MTYSIPQIDPEFVYALMAQEEPEVVTTALQLFTVGILQGISSVLREHAMILLLQDVQQPYVNGWLDAADTFDLAPPPRECENEQTEKES